MAHIPFLKLLDGLGLPLGDTVGAGHGRVAMGAALLGLIDHRTAIVTFDFHVAAIEMMRQN